MFPILKISVSTFSLFGTVGLLTAALFLYTRAEEYDIGFKNFLILGLMGVVFAFIFSRIIFVISQIPNTSEDFSINKSIQWLFTGGIVFYGGLIGFLFSVILFCKIFKKDKTVYFSWLTPAIPLFHMFARIGCLMGGCCYGIESSWGIVLAADPGVVRLPVQLFESICNLFILITLLLYQSKHKVSKYTLYIYLFLYSICRFILEFFRGDAVRGIWLFLSTSQIISLIMLVVSLPKIIGLLKNHKKIKLTALKKT